MKKVSRRAISNIIMPAIGFGFITGTLTGILISLYKLCAKYVINLSHTLYAEVIKNPLLILACTAAFFGLAVLLSKVYKREPNLKGGGIPTSIGILRGSIRINCVKNIIGTFFLSLTSFLTGVPLGNEGPSVQIGTALGGGVSLLQKRHRAWDRYAMTGGASAGFGVATGATVAGVTFALEEAHQRISPTILLVSSSAVIFARITAELLSPILGVSVMLFPEIELITLPLSGLWLPLLIGVVSGLFAVCFLYGYKLIKSFFEKTLHKLKYVYKIFLVYLLCFGAGLISSSFASTGHELILSLISQRPDILLLVAIIVIRGVLTSSANANSLTGGIFLPLLAIGASLSALTAGICESIFALSGEYYSLILMLGITACIAGMMKMPLTAIVFAIEALGCHGNVLSVLTVSAVSYFMTELFGAKSINDSVLEEKLKGRKKGKIVERRITVKPGAFAIGRQVRDILWPMNLFVLSVKKSEEKRAEVDGYGEGALSEGDILQVRYSLSETGEEEKELFAIVGEQE